MDNPPDADSLLKALARAMEESRQLREAAEKNMPAADEFPAMIQQPVELEPDVDLLLLEDSDPTAPKAQS